MNIEDRRKSLGELEVGTAFEHHNCVYLKTDRLFDSDLKCVTCVKLATGNTFGIAKIAKVNVIKAKLVIE